MIFPLIVSVSASLSILLVEVAKVIAPAYELSPAIFLKAPLFEIPVPVRLKASAPIAITVFHQDHLILRQHCLQL